MREWSNDTIEPTPHKKDVAVALLLLSVETEFAHEKLDAAEFEQVSALQAAARVVLSVRVYDGIHLLDLLPGLLQCVYLGGRE